MSALTPLTWRRIGQCHIDMKMAMYRWVLQDGRLLPASLDVGGLRGRKMNPTSMGAVSARQVSQSENGVISKHICRNVCAVQPSVIQLDVKTTVMSDSRLFEHMDSFVGPGTE